MTTRWTARIGWLAWLVWAIASTPAQGAEGVDYVRDVKPVLAKRCVACHGPLTAKAGLRLDTAARLLKGGDSGPAAVAGSLDESPLIDAITGAGGWRMPPEGEGEPLTAAEIATIKAWVAAGANGPAVVEAEPADPRKHWAFQPPRRPAVPAVKNAGWVRNPIDAFLAAGHEAHGLTPAGPADRATLLRRVYLDLTGIAPTPDELHAFLADPSDTAYEAVVDRLLASPRHGERWGRHWMDVWRYSDWDGYGAEVRESQPHIWRWRDWIVESINADTGYDRMVVAMLAADEAAPGDASAARATGYLARNWYKFNRNVWIDNIIEHTSKAFLGLTLNCARCHDHKYDPVTQGEYYRLRAIFEPHEFRADRLPGQADVSKTGLVRVYDARPEAPTYLFRRGDEKDLDQSQAVTPGLPAIVARFGRFEARPVALPPDESHPALKAFIQQEALSQARAEVATREARHKGAAPGSPAASRAAAAVTAARASLVAVEARIAAEQAKYATPAPPNADLLARLAAIAERRAAVLEAEVSLAAVEAEIAEAKPAPDARPAANKKAAAVKALDAARAALARDDAGYTPLAPSYPTSSTGRRLALARWIVAPDNPLAARVAVNHVWLRHFGAPLVPSVTDFGLNGRPPTNPALLDWLAVELRERGWSLKALHRLIVTSQTYALRCTPDDDSAGAADVARDPANLYLWRMNPRRMEAEAVRDNVLAAAGTLSSAMGGPDLDPETGLTDHHRSLYFRHAKEKRVTFLRLFDSPSVTSCYRRTESVVPQQALALANSSLTRQQAALVAEKVWNECGEKAAVEPFLTRVFERLLGRLPTAAERDACAGYLAAQGPDAAKGRASLVHVLFNHGDFVTIR